MPNLLISYAHPNPAGKDRSSSGATNSQLNGQWVELRNNINQAVSMHGVSLVHQNYNQSCQRTGSDVLTPFNGTLGVGQSIHVHTGMGQGYQEGTVTHLFLNRGNYVWNNRCGDSLILQSGSAVIDWAAYGTDPPEGRILTRAVGQNWLS